MSTPLLFQRGINSGQLGLRIGDAGYGSLEFFLKCWTDLSDIMGSGNKI